MITPRKRWLVLLLSTIALALAVLVIKTVKSELVVQGHPLRHWLEVSSSYTEGSETARTNADAIIRGLGTAAIPYLMDQLETPPGWREKFGPRWNQFAENRGWPDQTFSHNQLQRASILRGYAVKGFEILGTNGASAIPELRKMVRDDRYAEDVAKVLGCIQSDEALDMLVLLLKHSDPNVRGRAVFSLTYFFDRNRLSRASNEFVRLVDDPDEETAAHAALAVARALPASEAIPVLTRKFNDPRNRVARGAMGVFFAAGPHAEPAMPAIATMLTNSDERTRRIATNVLILINPARAPEFGIITNGIEQRFYDLHHRVRREFATNDVPYLHQ